MPWNGSNLNGNKKKYPAQSHLPLKKVLFYATAILLLAILFIWYIFPSEMPDELNADTVTKKNSIIEEVKPQISKALPKQPEKNDIPYWERTSTNGLTHRQLMKWKIHHRPPAIITNNTSETELKPAYAIFNTYVDNDLASLLTFEPGSTIVGDPGYERWFTKAFLKSLETPIIVDEEDTPEQIQLKKDLIALKIDLKARYDAGEDIAEIMRKTHEEFQDMARSKEEIERAAKDLIRGRTDISEQDVDDIISAANIMLDQKGIAPIKLGPVAKRRLMRQRN